MKTALGTQLLREEREKRSSQVAYASRTASVSASTSAPESSTALSVLRTAKKNLRSVSRGRASDLADRFVKTHTEARRKRALEEMFVASRSRFMKIAYSILRNREDAEDAVQNAFLSGYLHFRSFEGRSALTTWFTRIVLNAALMIQRKRKPSAAAPFFDNSNSHEVNWLEGIPASQPDPETTHAEQETFDLVNGILGKMKPILRQALTMTYFDELSGPEACARLGISSATFKARLFRARRDLLDQAQQALLIRIQKTTSSDIRILKHVDDSRVCGDLNP
jgi:RNA polymerase sigma-70 factor (ECF subfamily)